MSVAHATPSTPHLKVEAKAVTKRMSIPIFDTDENIRKTNGVRESPSAEKIPVATL